MLDDPSLEKYVDYEAFVIDKLQRLHNIEREVISSQKYEAVKDIRDFEKSLFNNLSYWYLKESTMPSRLSREYRKVLRSDYNGKGNTTDKGFQP